MGLFKKSCYTNPSEPTAVQPNPDVFEVRYVREIGEYYMSWVHYPNATNYEGNKVLVTTFDPRNRIRLDPHFSPNSGIVARFEPTTEGVKNAVVFCKHC